MKASELIETLQRSINAHGDSDVKVHIIDDNDHYAIKEYTVPVIDACGISEISSRSTKVEIQLTARIY